MFIKKALIHIWVFIYWIFAWFYRLVLLPFISIFFNIFFFFKIIFTGKLISVIKKMKYISKISTIPHMNLEYSKFRYTYEGFYDVEERSLKKRPIFSMWPTWICPTFIFVSRGKKGNCDDAARFARKLFRSYLKNNKKERKKYRIRTCVYIPWLIPDCFTSIHYIVEVINKTNSSSEIFSNGLISFETKDSLASRYLKHKNFFWMRNPFKISIN